MTQAVWRNHPPRVDAFCLGISRVCPSSKASRHCRQHARRFLDGCTSATYTLGGMPSCAAPRSPPLGPPAAGGAGGGGAGADGGPVADPVAALAADAAGGCCSLGVSGAVASPAAMPACHPGANSGPGWPASPTRCPLYPHLRLKRVCLRTGMPRIGHWNIHSLPGLATRRVTRGRLLRMPLTRHRPANLALAGPLLRWR